MVTYFWIVHAYIASGKIHESSLSLFASLKTVFKIICIDCLWLKLVMNWYLFQGQCTAAKAICWHDSHPHFCRSSCSVRPHRRHYSFISGWAISGGLSETSHPMANMNLYQLSVHHIHNFAVIYYILQDRQTWKSWIFTWDLLIYSPFWGVTLYGTCIFHKQISHCLLFLVFVLFYNQKNKNCWRLLLVNFKLH